MGSMGTAKGFKVSGEFIYVFFPPLCIVTTTPQPLFGPSRPWSPFQLCGLCCLLCCGHLALRADGNGAVLHQMAGSGAQVDGHGTENASPGQKSRFPDGLGDLRQFLSKSRALGHTNKSWTAGYTKEGDVKEGTTGDSGDRSKKVLSVLNASTSAQGETC